ncbi:ATP synthase F1 subunit gamma [Engelhardtia mirabilis]|uniref:ATP synthase gamma chain n=1 Tax=Engelhardtia mirabilis TaxID=2528011 RepID=A0A518BK49_9BACT|nr:ATP synthase gamma chain [Planctomycetes bacterium Pla133]QDV01676.1 ATP synthase gamma chain [Planctomycetes bacterium Pla86]
MAGIRELRGRIKSVGNIKQITRAMEMVASTKLRRFQDRAVASRPYATEITGLVGRLAGVLGEDLADRPLFKPGAGEATAVLLVTSDRGLCGGYNANVFRVLEEWLLARKESGDNSSVHFFVYGRKGYKYLTKRGHKVERYLVEPPLEEIDFPNAARTAAVLTQAFETGAYRDVKMIFTAFISAAKYVPESVPFLPIAPDALGAGDSGSDGSSDLAAGGDVLLEPDANSIFDSLIPRYLETRIYNALIESLTSEYASRRASMKNATDAASDMQGELKLLYNRLRQETITKELLDIVGGAEAVR